MSAIKEAPEPKTSNGPGQTKAIVPPVATAPQRVMESPFAVMRRFAEEMDRFFEDFGFETGWPMSRFFTRGPGLPRRAVGFVPAEWSPRVDVLERQGQWVVRVDLPGLTREEIQVEVTEELLTIHGERKETKDEAHKGYRYSECCYGNFYRAIPLPEGVDPAKATADFHKGVLEVVMPKPARPQPKARRLEIGERK
jgi:HSP20 family protein